MMKLTHTIALMLCGCLAACTSAPKRPTADGLFVGRIVTMDPDRPLAEAVAIKDGRIIAVGTERELKPYLGAETRITDLDDGALLPGFIDLRGELLRTAGDAGESGDLASAQRAAAKLGVTTSTIDAATADDLALLDAANLAGLLELDVVALPLASEATRLIGRRDFQRYRGRLRLEGIRFDVVGDEPEAWNRLVRHCAANDVRVFAICKDALGIDRTLDALEALPAGMRAYRPAVIHAVEPNATQLERCAALGALTANSDASRRTVHEFTSEAAQRLDESDEKGSIAPGKRADFVVLSADPTGLTGSELRELEVWQTYKNGRLIYELEGRPLHPFRKLREDWM